MTMLMHHMLRAAAGYAAPAPATTDPQFPYVSLLLNDTGTNGQQNNTFLDSSSNNFTITRNGTPTQGSVTPYWPDGQWSNYFSGSTQYLTVATNAVFTYATGDFTIEGWAQLGKTGAIQYLVDQRNSGTASAVIPSIYVSASDVLTYYVSGAAQITGTTALTVGAWFHFAVSRSGTSTKLFLNGVQEGSTYSDSNNYAASRVVLASEADTAANFLQGYLSNVRLVKGTAVYTSNFTPSTTPLTAVSGTSLLTCQSNRFKDNSSNNFAITVTGTPTVQAFEPFEPTASYSAATYGGSYFGSTSTYLSFTGTNAAFQFGTGDWTIEAWVNPTTIQQQRICDFRPSSNGAYPTVGMNSSGQFDYTANAAVRITGTTVAKPNTWYHVAVTRSGTSTKLFVNGVQEGVTYSDSSTYTVASNRPYIGGDSFTANTNIWAGYISNLRMVKGTAVYTTAFTPPTAPVTAITGTSLLLNATNAGIYDAAVLNDLTTVGNAQVSTAQAKWGGSSMAFDGTGDWLTINDNPTQRLGTGNFTVEGWVYLTATGVAYGLVSKGTATTGWSVNVTSGNKLQFSYTSSNLTGATSLSSGTWYYFAVVRSGSATGNLKLYLSGSVDATSAGAVTDNFNQTSTVYIGADRVGGSALNGYLDDIRVTNGYARTISTPTAAFPTR